VKHLSGIVAAACLLAVAAWFSPSRAGDETVTFTDPAEQAFTVQVPKGWLMQGGVERKAAYLAHPWLAVSTPDGTTTMFINDPELPTFTLPSAQHAEGTWVAAGVIGQAAAMHYENGQEFAAEYGKRTFAKSCGNVQLKGTRPDPEFAQAASAEGNKLRAQIGVQGPPPQIDAGSALFTCQIKGKPYLAEVFVVTQLAQFGNGGFWLVPDTWIMGFRTPADQQGHAERILHVMRDSFEITPQWRQRMNAAVQVGLQQIRAQGQEAMAALQQQADEANRMLRQQFESNMASQNERHDAFMSMMDQQEQDRNNAFDDHMQQKSINHFNEMLYITNNRCVAYYNNDIHQGCHYYAPN
jgi:hypothetical protein